MPKRHREKTYLGVQLKEKRRKAKGALVQAMLTSNKEHKYLSQNRAVWEEFHLPNGRSPCCRLNTSSEISETKGNLFKVFNKEEFMGRPFAMMSSQLHPSPAKTFLWGHHSQVLLSQAGAQLDF